MSAKDNDARIKSWIWLAAGLVGIGYQQYTGKVHWLLLLIFTGMTGVTFFNEIISVIRNWQNTSQSSISQQEHSEQESDK